MLRPGLALIVPCYNEAARLNPQAFLDFVTSHPSVWLLFVDDGSADDTFRILDRVQKTAPDSIGVLRMTSHQGKAEAVRLGILEGIRREADLVGFWDADLSTPLLAVDDFLALAEHARRTYGEGELVLGGFSFGGFVAASVAGRLEPKHLVLAAPAVGRFPVGKVPAGTLVVHGEEDDVVPLKDALDWARPQQLPIVVLPGAGHFFHGNLVTLQKLVEQYCRA